MIEGIKNIFQISEVYKEVKEEKNKLILNEEVVRKRVEEIDHTTETINNVVFEWQKETKIVLLELENLITKERTQSWSEFWATRTEHTTKYFYVVLRKVIALNVKCDFDQVSTSISSLEHSSNENILYVPTREVVSNQLLEALIDVNSSIIGLYGRQGSGKTTLVETMIEKLKDLMIFGNVLFVNVTQNVNIREMQDEIAEFINIRFEIDSNSEAERARKIFSTIESMEDRILVIFDDVRARFELESVGIPRNSNICKVFLITRSQQECTLMNCEKEIHLGPLTTREIWTLFKKHSGIHEEEDTASFDLLNVAQQVAFQCEGLPGIIKEIGSYLRREPLVMWKIHLDFLRCSRTKWQIFLNFRENSTRHSFTNFLYQALHKAGYNVFFDDDGLEDREQLPFYLLKTIETSKLCIIVLSKNYASSSQCLDELVKILECKRTNNQLVWPIFYKVKPSDIKHMRKSYGNAMAQHENTFGGTSERVEKWREALIEVSTLPGNAYTTAQYECEFIHEIVEKVKNLQIKWD